MKKVKHNCKIIILLGMALLIISDLQSQPLYDYSSPFMATSQLGFREESPKEITFFAGSLVDDLADEIPFFITKAGYRLPRKTNVPIQWEVDNNVFRWPINNELAGYKKEVFADDYEGYLYKGILKRIETRWGTMWRGNFDDFSEPGLYQLENEYGFSVPFQINNAVYERLERGYLEFMECQRSGIEIPGIRPEENSDDARFYSDSSYYLPVAGGWNDAGDYRKWLFLTLPNLDALGQIVKYGHPAFRNQAIEEIKWGNQYFQNMINDEGRVYEDVGGGKNRAGNYEDSWWNENHPGVTATGDLESDNIPLNHIERHVRENYNPLVQYQFVRHQALASTVLKGPYKSNTLVLADRAWKYALKTSDDQRTLFVAEKLLAAIELYLAGSPSVKLTDIENTAEEVLKRQELNSTGLSGYFMEKDNKDGYRSIAFSQEPAMALLRLLEADIAALNHLNQKAEKALISYIEDYLLKDAESNPFHIPPYGIYTDPPYADFQEFRKANDKRYVRTFIHIFSDNPIPHGVNQVFLQQGYLLARAGKLFHNNEWQRHAEKILNWTMGHNTYGLCLFTGVGFKHAVPSSFVNYKIPSAAMVGFIGTPDDRPYLETSNLLEWSTQEIWDVPYYFTIGLISFLD